MWNDKGWIYKIYVCFFFSQWSTFLCRKDTRHFRISPHCMAWTVYYHIYALRETAYNRLQTTVARTARTKYSGTLNLTWKVTILVWSNPKINKLRQDFPFPNMQLTLFLTCWNKLPMYTSSVISIALDIMMALDMDWKWMCTVVTVRKNFISRGLYCSRNTIKNSNYDGH